MTGSIDGFFNVFKPAGITSFDVIRRIRPLLGRRSKVGHSGVIDKPAEGVLPIGVGHATRLFEELSAYSKDYQALIAFGLTSPTLDFGSEVTCGKFPASLSQAESLMAKVLEVSCSFIGDIEQIPPAFSNVKIDGRELYKYELKDEKVEAQPRHVRVFRLDFQSFQYLSDGLVTSLDGTDGNDEFAIPSHLPPAVSGLDCNVLYARLFVECGTGTYVRALARDIGQAVGCDAIIARLVRTRVGPFRHKDATDVNELAENIKRDCDVALAKYLHPPVTVIDTEMTVQVHSDEARQIANGGSIVVSFERIPGSLVQSEHIQPGLYAVNEDGRLVAKCLASEKQTQPEFWIISPVKVFV